MEQPNEAAQRARNRRRVKQGRVAIEQDGQDDRGRDRDARSAPVYQKIVRKSVRFKAHDEKNEANIGDIVRIMECRPLSRDKRWRLVEIVERAK